MNTVAGLTGLIVSIWGSWWIFTVMDVPGLGYGSIGLIFLSLIMTGVGVMEDVSSYNEFKHSGEDDN